MSSSTFRAFLGLPLPAPIRSTLTEYQHFFRAAGVRARWVPTENFHVTLCFLGNITHEQGAALDEVLPALVAEQSALQLKLSAPSAFPHAQEPAVIWCDPEILQGDPCALQRTLSDTVAAHGISLKRRAFQPHVTLFRMRRGHGLSTVSRCLEAPPTPRSDAFWVDSVALWRSELRRGGAAYHLLKEYPLK